MATNCEEYVKTVIRSMGLQLAPREINRLIREMRRDVRLIGRRAARALFHNTLTLKVNA